MRLYFSSNGGWARGHDIYAVPRVGWPVGRPEQLPFPVNRSTTMSSSFPSRMVVMSSNRAAKGEFTPPGALSVPFERAR